MMVCLSKPIQFTIGRLSRLIQFIGQLRMEMGRVQAYIGFMISGSMIRF